MAKPEEFTPLMDIGRMIDATEEEVATLMSIFEGEGIGIPANRKKDGAIPLAVETRLGRERGRYLLSRLGRNSRALSAMMGRAQDAHDHAIQERGQAFGGLSRDRQVRSARLAIREVRRNMDR